MAAQRLVINAAGVLTADRTSLLRCTKTLPAGTAYNGEAQAVIRIKNPVGILQVGLSIKGTVGGVPSQSFGMGARFVSADANLLPTTDETFEYMFPGSLPFDPGTLIDLQVAIVGKSGMTPSGEVYVGQVGYHLLTGLPA